MITAAAITAYVCVGYGAFKGVRNNQSIFEAKTPSLFGGLIVFAMWPIYALITLGYRLVTA